VTVGGVTGAASGDAFTDAARCASVDVDGGGTASGTALALAGASDRAGRLDCLAIAKSATTTNAPRTRVRIRFALMAQARFMRHRAAAALRQPSECVRK
jgi:hypothetical protein